MLWFKKTLRAILFMNQEDFEMLMLIHMEPWHAGTDKERPKEWSSILRQFTCKHAKYKECCAARVWHRCSFALMCLGLCIFGQTTTY